MGGDSFLDGFPFFRDIWSHKTSETLFLFVIFSILGRSPRTVNDLLTSPSNQFWDYFIWNRIEKLVPLNWNFAPQILKTSTNRPTRFQTLIFLWNLGFQKTGICPRQPPEGVYISRKDHQRTDFSGKLQKHQKAANCDKWLLFVCPFFGPIPFFGPH